MEVEVGDAKKGATSVDVVDVNNGDDSDVESGGGGGRVG